MQFYKVTVQHGIVNDHCVDNGQSFNSLFKDCVKYCTDDACNDIFDEIAEEFDLTLEIPTLEEVD